MIGYIRHIAHSITYWCVAATLACNYFAFQVELFQDEYEANQPIQSETGDAISGPTITWESFDKDHAQKPFVFNAIVEIECVVHLRPILTIPLFEQPSRQLIRDKSPPLFPALV